MTAAAKGASAVDRVRARRPVPQLGLSKVEAAESLSMSVDSFERYVLPHVKVLRRGRLVVVPVVELERFLEREAEGLL